METRPGESARRVARPPDIDPLELDALGAAVRELRARGRFTQASLGKRAGLHHNYVGSIERGEINSTFRILRKVADGLAVPLSELMKRYERQRARAVKTRR
jgi:transcriptional regulator with XRE-family HTH domain